MDLVSILRTPVTYIVSPVIPINNLLTKQGFRASSLKVRLHRLWWEMPLGLPLKDSRLGGKKVRQALGFRV